MNARDADVPGVRSSAGVSRAPLDGAPVNGAPVNGALDLATDRLTTHSFQQMR